MAATRDTQSTEEEEEEEDDDDEDDGDDGDDEEKEEEDDDDDDEERLETHGDTVLERHKIKCERDMQSMGKMGRGRGE